MLGAMWHREAGPIGVDVGAHSIKMVQLTGRGDRQRILAAASRALPSEASRGVSPPDSYHESVTQAVREMLACEPFVGRRAVSSLPTWALKVQNIRLPRMPADELAQAVRFEAAERLGETPMEVQFFNAGEVRQGEELRQEIILLAAQRDFIQDHVESLIDAGLRLAAIEAAPAALRRSLTPVSEIHRGVPRLDPSLRGQAVPLAQGARLGLADSTQAVAPATHAPVVIVDVGYHATAVVIAQGQQVLFFKLIEIGGRRLDEAVAQRLHLDIAEAAVLRRSQAFSHSANDGRDARPTEAGQAVAPPAAAQPSEMMQATRPLLMELSREVALCLRYYSVTFRGQRPASAVLAGGEARQAGLKATLAEQAAVAVEIARPISSMAEEKWPREACGGAGLQGFPGLAAWATAAGLALHRQDAAAAAQRRAA